jgi:ribosome-associated toxin RatA of RatAB toxin-antitoxin module
MPRGIFLTLSLTIVFFFCIPPELSPAEVPMPMEADIPFAVEVVIPSGEVLKAILGKPRVISSGIASEKGDDNSRWIRMFADVHVCTGIPLSRLYAVITNYGNYPAYFKRNRSVQVFPAEPEGVYQDAEVGISLMGISYISRYRTLIREKKNTPSGFILEFTGISSDGSVKDLFAQWFFETVLVDGRPHTYIRYTFSNAVARKNIFQKAVMSMFIDSEALAMLNQLLLASQ